MRRKSNEPRASKLREQNLSRCVNGIHAILPTGGFELNVASVMKSAKHLTWTWGIGHDCVFYIFNVFSDISVKVYLHHLYFCETWVLSRGRSSEFLSYRSLTICVKEISGSRHVSQFIASFDLPLPSIPGPWPRVHK